jgi:hypothetical protein
MLHWMRMSLGRIIFDALWGSYFFFRSAIHVRTALALSCASRNTGKITGISEISNTTRIELTFPLSLIKAAHELGAFA